MIEITNESIGLIAIIIIGLIILKILGKFFFRLVGAIILFIFAAGYTYFYTDFFKKNQDNLIVQAIEEKIDFVSVIDYNAKHCNKENMSRRDSITCECIITPLVKDLKKNFTEQELNELRKDKQKYRKELIAALDRNQDLIKAKLKERNSISLWNILVKNLQKGILVGEEKE